MKLKFKFTGSYFRVFILFILWSIAAALTFGIAAPFGITHIVAYFIEQTEANEI